VQTKRPKYLERQRKYLSPFQVHTNLHAYMLSE
jgi:hypothetical protein